MVPRTSATAVAPRPTLMLVHSAVRTPGLSIVRCHHDKVNDCGGQPKVLEALKELASTTSSGT